MDSEYSQYSIIMDRTEGKPVTIWTVTRLTSYIKNLFAGDTNLRNVWVKGEISGFKRAYSGHCYFTLKDSGAAIACVMFQSRAQGVQFEITNGLSVLALGNITVYEKNGNYQLIVEQLKPEGIGELYLKFLQVKEKLLKLGYFDSTRKKRIPFIPKGIGIATSTAGAALHDMITTITSRFPCAKIYIAPTIVQGDEAPLSIANSLKLLDQFDPVDVIILGRGGGSFEDLNCFNSEMVAEAIFKCKKPIISAVGHETDFTISDMVADLRAATPTASAQAVVPDLRDLLYDLELKKSRLIQGLTSVTKSRKEKLSSLAPQRLSVATLNIIESYNQNLDYIMENMISKVTGRLEKFSRDMDRIGDTLNALSPFRVLERGYAIVKDHSSGSIIGKGEDTHPGQEVDIVFSDRQVVAIIRG